MRAAVEVVRGVDVERADLFASVCEHAEKLLRAVTFSRVLASRQWLAEVPGREWEFWALGETQDAARAELMTVVCGVLQRRLGARAERREW